MPGPDSKNPSPNDVTKDIASRLKTDGNKGFAELDVQSPGARPGVQTPGGSRQGSVDKPAQVAFVQRARLCGAALQCLLEMKSGCSTVSPSDSVDMLRRI